jgi:catechol 2,3-dioxygenase-like lactoylglutathione lyase family enzyme
VQVKIRRLEHYNIRTTRFEETVKFYEDVLGMKCARAPMAPETMPPTWIYDDSGIAAVHLTPVDPKDPEGSYAKIAQYRGVDDDVAFQGSGAIDHVAFECEGYDEILGRLESRSVEYAANDFPKFGLRQLFFKDPNGVTLELNFR